MNPYSNKFVAGVEITATGESKLYDSHRLQLTEIDKENFIVIHVSYFYKQERINIYFFVLSDHQNGVHYLIPTMADRYCSFPSPTEL